MVSFLADKLGVEAKFRVGLEVCTAFGKVLCGAYNLFGQVELCHSIFRAYEMIHEPAARGNGGVSAECRESIPITIIHEGPCPRQGRFAPWRAQRGAMLRAACALNYSTLYS